MREVYSVDSTVSSLCALYQWQRKSEIVDGMIALVRRAPEMSGVISEECPEREKGGDRVSLTVEAIRNLVESLSPRRSPQKSL